jgi:hypothetical protein
MSKLKVLDFVERVSATFGAAFLGLALVTGVSTPKDLEAAAIAGGMSAAKFAYVELNAYLGTKT